MKSNEIFSTVFAKAKDLANEIHLSYHWVACWIETIEGIELEVTYVGSRENAPYK